MLKTDQPVVGYRNWYVSSAGLYSIFAGYIWTPGENRAECGMRTMWWHSFRLDHEFCPSPDCRCGLHAYARAEEVPIGESTVTGAVVLYGRMYCGGRHIRASHAEVVALSCARPAVTYASGAEVDALARQYVVPVVGSLETLRMVAGEFGRELSDRELRHLKPGRLRCLWKGLTFW